MDYSILPSITLPRARLCPPFIKTVQSHICAVQHDVARGFMEPECELNVLPTLRNDVHKRAFQRLQMLLLHRNPLGIAPSRTANMRLQLRNMSS